MTYVLAAGLWQTCAAFILLLLNRAKHKGDHLLLLLLCAIGWHLSTKLFIFSRLPDPEVVFRMHTFIQLAYGPLIYLYILKNRDPQFHPATRWYFFLPLLMASILYGSAITVLVWSPALGHRLLNIYNQGSFYLILSVHVVFSYFSLRACRRPAAQGNDYKLGATLSQLLILTGVLEVVLVLAGNYNPAYNAVVRIFLYAAIGAMPFLVIRYKYEGLTGKSLTFQRTSPVLADYPATEPVEVAAEEEKKSLLSPERQQEIWQAMETYFQQSKAYREEDFNLDKLAVALGISRYYISETLNKYAGKPFYQYLNEQRIQEAIRQINHCVDKAIPVNILMIAHDSGFKAKSSFNQYFKKMTGETPSGFIKNRENSMR